MKPYKLLYSSKSINRLVEVDEIINDNAIYHWSYEDYADCWVFYLYCDDEDIYDLEKELEFNELYNYCIIDMEKQYDYQELKAQNAETEL